MKRLAFLLLLLIPSTAFAQSATAAADGGSSVVIGGDVDGWAAHIVFDFADGINQVDIARLTQWVDARASVPFSVGFNRDPCKTYQYDTVWGVNPAAQYTMSDLGNLPLLASGKLYPTANCWNPPDVPTPPPPQPSCVNTSFTFGGEPAIARFPDGFMDPWLPLWRGPFYLNVPAHRYHLYAWTYDAHSVKHDGTQDAEIGEFWLETENGMLIVGPTLDIPDDSDYAFSDLSVWDIPDVKLFYAVHALRGSVSEPTDSFSPLVLYFNCVQP